LKKSDPKVQKSIVESLDSERAADIVEEMDPDAAADLSRRSLPGSHRTNPRRDGARGQPGSRRTARAPRRNRCWPHDTEFLALPVTATVENAIGVLRGNSKGGVETVGTIYLVDSHGTLAGAVPSPNSY